MNDKDNINEQQQQWAPTYKMNPAEDEYFISSDAKHIIEKNLDKNLHKKI